MEKEQQLESVRGTEKSTIHSLHMLLCVWQWSDKKDEISMKSFEQLLPRFTSSSLKVYFFYGLTKERKEEWKAAFMSSCLPNRFKDWGISIQMYKKFSSVIFFSLLLCVLYIFQMKSEMSFSSSLTFINSTFASLYHERGKLEVFLHTFLLYFKKAWRINEEFRNVQV